MFNVTEIVVAVIGLLGTIITVVVVPLLKTKLTTAKREELATWVKIAVTAAEQIFTGTQAGEDKLEYVLQWMRDHGVDLDDTRVLAEVRLLIEAFVGEMNGKAVKATLGDGIAK